MSTAPKTLLLLLVAGALAGIWAWSFAGNKPASTQPSTQPASSTLRAMTANIRLAEPDDGVNAWPNRREFLVKTLLKQGADVIGCQEVSPAQGAYLIKELGKWYANYPRAGVGKPAPEDAGNKLIGAVNATFASLNTLFYKADRFDILDGEAGLVLPDQLQKEPTENTFYSLAVLKEKAAGGKTFIVLDTHLRHRDDFAIKCALALRVKIAAQLAAHPGANVIVMGDMNHDRNSKEYIALVGVESAIDGAGKLNDSFDYSQKRPNDHWGNWHAFTGHSAADLPTDLILTRGLTAKSTTIVRDQDPNGHYPSDHFFVVTDLDEN